MSRNYRPIFSPFAWRSRSDLYPISLSHYTSLSLSLSFFCYGPLPHLSPPLVSPSSLGLLYITCYPLARGLLIALILEALCTSETSVNFNVTTRRNIPEHSKLHTRRSEDLTSHTSLLYSYSCRNGFFSGEGVNGDGVRVYSVYVHWQR
jgi:hypothetical protein